MRYSHGFKIKTMLVFGHLRQISSLKISQSQTVFGHLRRDFRLSLSESVLNFLWHGAPFRNTKAFPLMAEHTRLSFSLTTQVHLPPRAFNAEIEGSLHVNHSFCPITLNYQMCCKPLLVIYCLGQNIELLKWVIYFN